MAIGRRPGAKRTVTRALHRQADRDDFQANEAHLRILQAIKRIPKGKIATYGGVAKIAGLPGRARLVGRLLRVHPLAEGVPWHRVVNAGGRISIRSECAESEQRKRLELEGVRLDPRNRIDLSKFLWRGSSKNSAKKRVLR